MTLNYIVSPGTILKEYMKSRNITQKELSLITGSSERYISNLINSKLKLSEEFALKLENVFNDVKAEFWMELESTYRLNLLREQKSPYESIEEISKEYQFNYVFKGLGYNIKKQAEEMLKILEVNSFDEVESKIQNLSYCFMEDGGNKKAIYLWVKLCEEEIDIQNDMDFMEKFSREQLSEKILQFKNLMYTQDFNLALNNLRRFSNMLGIALVILEAIPNSKVRGATTIINEHPVIFLSKRFKRLDTFYFAYIHEIAHILSDDFKKVKYNVTLEVDDELESNTFTRNFFIDDNAYKNFLENHSTEDSISEEDIALFSKEQRIIPDVLLGYLEHDKIITNFSRFYYLKGKV